jgi:hypothetical protein
MGSVDRVFDFPVLRPKSAHGNPEESAAHLMQKAAPVQFTARVYALEIHAVT